MVTANDSAEAWGFLRPLTWQHVLPVVAGAGRGVIVPHSTLWSNRIANATSGNRSVLCVADFYLHPDHDAALAQRRLIDVGGGSAYRKADTPVSVIVHEKPWGTHYRLKAYVKERREQFEFITDLTIRGHEALRAVGIRFAQATYAETTG